MLSEAADHASLAAFAPAEGSKAFQTPYGSLQLASAALQQSFGPVQSGLGGTLVPDGSEEDDEEDDDDDDDENGNKKRKRKQQAAAAKKAGLVGGQAMPAVGGGARPSGQVSQASGERDTHTGRRKIRIEFIEDDSRRHITFSKRKAGIMKKAYELATLTGTQVLLLIVSQTGLVYTFTTPKLSPVVQQAAGRELIQSCLNAPDPSEAATEEDGLRSALESHSQSSAVSVNPGSVANTHSNPLNAPSHLATGVHSHTPSVYNAAGFNDPRQQAALMGMTSVPGMSMSLPAHMQGMGAAYGYSNLQQLVGHEAGMPYGSYGM